MLSVNESNFESVVLGSRLPVVVMAYADRCPSCQRIAPLIEAHEKRLEGRVLMVKVNVDESQHLASELRLNSLPALMVYRGGKEVTRLVGLQNVQNLIEALDLENACTIPADTSTLSARNQIQVIAPYWHAGTWVFDDERTGLVKEPFVNGIPAMINELVQSIPNARSGFRLLFSTDPFPGYERKLSWVRAEMGGNWYRTEQPQGEGWLCPALFRYFAVAPQTLFVKAENLN